MLDDIGERTRRSLREAPDRAELLALDDADADRVFDALASETTRAALAALHEEPRSPTDLATALDTSLQNASYHIDKLESAGLVEPVATRYAANGREVTIYGPTHEAVVLVAGRRDVTTRLRRALSRWLGVGLLVLLAAGAYLGAVTSRGTFFGPMAAAREPDYTATHLLVAFAAGGLFALGVVWLRRVARARLPARAPTDRASLRYGADRDLSLRALGVALGLALLAATLRAEPVDALFETTIYPTFGLTLVGSAVAAVYAYRNNGLVVCLALAGAPVVGVGVSVVIGPSLAGPLMLGLFVGIAAFVGLLFGGAGFLVGVGLRRVVAGDDSLPVPTRRETAVLAAIVALCLLYAHGMTTGWIPPL